MLGIKYFKADASTFVIKTVNGKARAAGRGLSFFYNGATTSIAALPVNALDAPFIYNLPTADFQTVRVQGQVTFRLAEPEKTAEMLNFSVKEANDYVSDDPRKLGDRVVQITQSILGDRVQSQPVREILLESQQLGEIIRQQLPEEPALLHMGIHIVDASVMAVTPSPETAQALEAEVRESILKEADDAIYARRRAAVEQERTIKDAELQTELSVQQKEQEIAESRVENERALMHSKAQTEQERIDAEIHRETQRKALVEVSVENARQEADADAYAMSVKINAYKELPVENLKAMALARMSPEQLMAAAMDSLAQNAGKIGELNITPDLFGHLIKRAKA